MWKVEELTEKIDRIKELSDAEFNIPRFYYIPHTEYGKIQEALRWAVGTGKKTFNVRTYTRHGKKEEGVQNPHYTDIPGKKLNPLLKDIVSKYYCMVDAETPDDGRWAGNVLIYTSPFKVPDKFTIEYCKKDLRAMVRDADKSITEDIREIDKLEATLQEVVKKALTFPRKEVILEWTKFCKPAGVFHEEIVWWEYRKF